MSEENEKNPMDLNGDGKVTFGEKVVYHAGEAGEKVKEVVNKAKDKAKDIYADAKEKVASIKAKMDDD